MAGNNTERAYCKYCKKPLVARDEELGYHPSCKEEVRFYHDHKWLTPLKPGLYQTEERVTPGGLKYYYYLYFSPSFVVGVSSPEEADEVLEWIVSEESTGQYQLNEKHVQFKLASHEGDVEFDGTILPNERLELKVFSNINQNRTTRVYQYVPKSSLGRRVRVLSDADEAEDLES